MRYSLTPIGSADEWATLDRIWAASQDTDDRAFRPRDGWWPLSGWATRGALLLADGAPAGGLAVNRAPDGAPAGGLAVNRAPDGATEARLALLPVHRTTAAARLLVGAAYDEARISGGPRLRLTLPAWAAWARGAASTAGLVAARATLVMLRPNDLGPLLAAEVPGITIRPLAQGEEGHLLHALNHAWASTWNFRPLTRRALERDLAGQRQGFLVAVDHSGRIAGTAHAQFDPAGRNPDGAPYAWIANLTTAPERRGRGLGRTLLGAAIAHLHQRGAHSTALGVDSGAAAPIALYRSAGFAEVDRLELWEAALPPSIDAAPGKLVLYEATA